MSEFITVFDIEVLNMDPASVCSIGIVQLRNMKVYKEYYSLIRPADLSFDKYRYDVHHISPKMLVNQKSFLEVWEDIKPFFENQIVVSHDIQSDMSSIRAALKKNRIPFPRMWMSCTNVLAHLVEPDLKKYNVTDLCSHYHIQIDHPHHALYDAKAAAEILHKLILKSDASSLAELHEIHHIEMGEMRENYYRNIIAPEHAPMNVKRKYIFTNQSVVFTGNTRVSKEQLSMHLKKVHGYYNRDVNTHTDYLVIGHFGYYKTRYGKSNKKVKKALTLKRMGQDIKIISEKEYMRMLNRKTRSY